MWNICGPGETALAGELPGFAGPQGTAELGPDPHTARLHAAAAVVRYPGHEVIVLSGGMVSNELLAHDQETESCLSTVEAFDISTQEW
jgi:hypothetical protein